MTVKNCVGCFYRRRLNTPPKKNMKMRSPTLFAALLFSAPAAWCSTVIDNLASTPLPGQPAYGLTFFKDFGYRVASLFETGTKPTSIESITFRFNSNFSDSFLISLHSVQGGRPDDPGLASDPLSIPPSTVQFEAFDVTVAPPTISSLVLQPSSAYALVLSASLRAANWTLANPASGYVTAEGSQFLGTLQQLPYLTQPPFNLPDSWLESSPVIYRLDVEVVPGPLPVLGVWVGFRQSRRLRRRLKGTPADSVHSALICL